MLYVRDVEKVCGGAIGKQSSRVERFCAASPGLCDVQSHKRSKVDLNPDTLHVRVSKKGADQATLAHSLSVYLLTADGHW